MLRTEDWLQAGFTVLARDGEPGLRVDRLAAHLGVTKGSFHHHFAGVAGFRTALLAAHEAEQAALVELARTATAPLPVPAALGALGPLVAEHLDLPRERALRAWAVSSPEVAATVARIDAARLDLLVDLWSQVLPRDRARPAALVPHLALIGAITTDISGRELGAVFDLLTVTTSAVIAEPDPAEPHR